MGGRSCNCSSFLYCVCNVRFSPKSSSHSVMKHFGDQTKLQFCHLIALIEVAKFVNHIMQRRREHFGDFSH